VEAALDAAGVSNAEFAAAEFEHLTRGQSALISLNGTPVGQIGRLGEEYAARFKFRQPVYVCELDLQQSLRAPVKPPVYQVLAKFPAVVRDITFIVKRDFSFQQLRRAIVEQGFDLLREVKFVDLYEGKGMAADERSITFRLEYRSDDRTLMDEEVEAVHHQIVSRVQDAFDIKQRT
jgi:phenylalanyl-tRNA synthetase beta chain